MEVHVVRPSEIHGRTVILGGVEARHVVKVLRHGVGDPLLLTDGAGRYLHTVIERAGAHEVKATIEREVIDPRETGAPWSTLGLALLKGDHFELAIEKATELGVHRIVPVLAQHCVVKWKEDGAERKIERWQRVAESAMKQSGRSWCPQVTAPMTLDALIGSLSPETMVVVGDEEESGRSVHELQMAPRGAHLALVGPEGAFSAQEKQWLADHGVIAVSLGPYRLRAETAAIALLAALYKERKYERVDP